MKQITVMALLFAIAFNVNAQTNTTGSSLVKFGIKGGVNSSTFNMKADGAQISSITSFYGGGIALFAVAKHFNIQSELIYSGEGSNANGVKMEQHFVRLPLLFQYEHASGFHVEAGPQLGVMIKSKATHIESKESINIDDKLSRISTTIAIGFGYRMKNGLGIDFRYAKGIDYPIASSDAKLVVASGGLSFVF